MPHRWSGEAAGDGHGQNRPPRACPSWRLSLNARCQQTHETMPVQGLHTMHRSTDSMHRSTDREIREHETAVRAAEQKIQDHLSARGAQWVSGVAALQRQKRVVDAFKSMENFHPSGWVGMLEEMTDSEIVELAASASRHADSAPASAVEHTVEHKLWCMSFNMETVDPFEGVPRDRQTAVIEELVPTSADIAAVGLQESPGDKFDAIMERVLARRGLVRLRAAKVTSQRSNATNACHADSRPHSSPMECTFQMTGAVQQDNSAADGCSQGWKKPKVQGRGDGAKLSGKYTSLALYARKTLVDTGAIELLG